MPVSELKNLDLPDWYTAERETEKIIEKLGRIKELDFYLRNPDEYVRRLAILRLHKLSDRDSIYILKEILDDEMESNENKYLAAWTLKSLSKNWEDDFLLTGRNLSYFNVYEGDYEELFSVRQINSNKPVQFNFALSPSYSEFQLDPEESSFEKDVLFDAQFEFKEWLDLAVKRIARNLVQAFLILPKLILKLPSSIFRFLKMLFCRPAKLKKAKSLNKQVKSEGSCISDYDSFRGSLYKEIYRKPSILEKIKNGAFQMLYFVFAPWRFLRKHKIGTATCFLLVFLLLANTDYGRAFTLKYMNMDLKEFQDSSIQKVREYSSYAVDKFNSALGIGSSYRDARVETLDGADVQNFDGLNNELYIVTAKDGLNMRRYPDPYSGKVGASNLIFGSTVTYLKKSQKDSDGRIWYYVRAKDGRIGWVSSAFLKELKKG